MSGNTHVSERLKSCREDLRLSQVMLAELAGINPTQLYRYESGKAKLPMEAANKIAAALGVGTAWLVHGTLPMARERQIVLPVPVLGGLIVNGLELSPTLADAVKRLATKNGSSVDIALLDLVQLGLDAMHTPTRACAESGSEK
ncbi:helix-turn-helix domain-containing protein [Janthinobacterium aquaticum]|uniref:helix-turn-helix domain-containing protein n=1 Tax=Janthinobacterium sp. FT58W TaxID=2654254 RepID=UPI0012651CCD|nr:helix-turn-helix transcriptional regulator [Janthinobacterium sp. FT58W]KAB8044563.1 helix-turn-helix domain-containing protein [Janthinobacterium sp. FT58W]